MSDDKKKKDSDGLVNQLRKFFGKEPLPEGNFINAGFSGSKLPPKKKK